MSTCQVVRDAIRAVNNFLPQPERWYFLMGYVQKVKSTFKEIILKFWEKRRGCSGWGRRGKFSKIKLSCDKIPLL